jgi:hypothetical protein
MGGREVLYAYYLNSSSSIAINAAIGVSWKDSKKKRTAK